MMPLSILGWHAKEQAFVMWFWLKPVCLDAILFRKPMQFCSFMHSMQDPLVVPTHFVPNVYASDLTPCKTVSVGIEHGSFIITLLSFILLWHWCFPVPIFYFGCNYPMSFHHQFALFAYVMWIQGKVFQRVGGWSRFLVSGVVRGLHSPYGTAHTPNWYDTYCRSNKPRTTAV